MTGGRLGAPAVAILVNQVCGLDMIDGGLNFDVPPKGHLRFTQPARCRDDEVSRRHMLRKTRQRAEDARWISGWNPQLSERAAG